VQAPRHPCKRGYRPIRVWVPDVRTESFAAEAHRQMATVVTLDQRGDDQAFIEAVSAPWDDE